MEFIKSNLSSVGAFLLGAGLLSIVLAALSAFDIVHLEVRILVWIDAWGKTIGWLIRIGVTAAGAALYLISRNAGSNSEDK